MKKKQQLKDLLDETKQKIDSCMDMLEVEDVETKLLKEASDDADGIAKTLREATHIIYDMLEKKTSADEKAKLNAMTFYIDDIYQQVKSKEHIALLNTLKSGNVENARELLNKIKKESKKIKQIYES